MFVAATHTTMSALLAHYYAALRVPAFDRDDATWRVALVKLYTASPHIHLRELFEVTYGILLPRHRIEPSFADWKELIVAVAGDLPVVQAFIDKLRYIYGTQHDDARMMQLYFSGIYRPVFCTRLYPPLCATEMELFRFFE